MSIMKIIKTIKNYFKTDYLITIIVPLYNIEESFISRAFNSITEQTLGFEHLEVIFVDDCSTFKEGVIFVKELTDLYSNVKLFKLNKNKGTGQARNFGLKKARGKYIMFLDQDDYYYENSCEILYNHVEKNNADMACGNYINLSRDGNEKVDWTIKGINDYILITENVNDNMELFKIDPSIWAKIFNKEFIEENDIHFCDYRGGDDLLFYHETLFKSKKIVNVNEPIIVYEQRINQNMDQTSFSLNNSFGALKDLMEIYKIDYDLFKKYNKNCIDISLKANINYFVNKRLKNSSLSYEEYRELIKSGDELFKCFVKHNLGINSYFNNMFNYIVNNDMDNAFFEYKKIVN